jgi:hypothetical protein
MGGYGGLTLGAAADTGSGLLKIPRVLVGDLVVPLNTQLPLVLNNQADGDFEMWFLSIFRTNALLKMLWEEGGSTRRFVYSGAQPITAQFNGVLVDNLAGLVANNGAFPIAVPYVFPANRNMTFTLTDSSGAQNTFEIALHGYVLLPVSTGG